MSVTQRLDWWPLARLLLPSLKLQMQSSPNLRATAQNCIPIEMTFSGRCMLPKSCSRASSLLVQKILNLRIAFWRQKGVNIFEELRFDDHRVGWGENIQRVAPDPVCTTRFSHPLHQRTFALHQWKMLTLHQKRFPLHQWSLELDQAKFRIPTSATRVLLLSITRRSKSDVGHWISQWW